MKHAILAILALAVQGDASFTLHTRRLADSKEVAWKAQETAVIICDMWDAHWCKSATRRCGELAPKIDAFAKAARAKGALIVHAPSDVVKFYEGTPQRKRAQDAPKVKTEKPIQGCRLDPTREAPLPVDDSDGGCDDEPRCPGKPSTIVRTWLVPKGPTLVELRFRRSWAASASRAPSFACLPT